MNIGVFDSGNGGRFVARKLEMLLPQHTYMVVSDPAHAPYGERTYEDIRKLTHTAIEPLVKACPLIVIACNTATAAAIDSLRITYPETIFVGFEPMIKPAASLTSTGRITLLATHATAHAPRTRQLIRNFAPNLTIETPATTDWAWRIDRDQADDIDLSEVRDTIERGSDTIIIGCTHYIALQPELELMGVPVLEPTEAIARHIEVLTAPQPQR